MLLYESRTSYPEQIAILMEMAEMPHARINIQIFVELLNEDRPKVVAYQQLLANTLKKLGYSGSFSPVQDYALHATLFEMHNTDAVRIRWDQAMKNLNDVITVPYLETVIEGRFIRANMSNSRIKPLQDEIVKRATQVGNPIYHNQGFQCHVTLGTDPTAIKPEHEEDVLLQEPGFRSLRFSGVKVIADRRNKTQR